MKVQSDFLRPVSGRWGGARTTSLGSSPPATGRQAPHYCHDPECPSPEPCGAHEPFGLLLTEALTLGAAQPIPWMEQLRPRGKQAEDGCRGGAAFPPPKAPHPSFSGDHSRLGPRTMAMLLGVILFTSCSSASRARNFIRYLGGGKGAWASGIWGLGAPRAAPQDPRLLQSKCPKSGKDTTKDI